MENAGSTGAVTCAARTCYIGVSMVCSNETIYTDKNGVSLQTCNETISNHNHKRGSMQCEMCGREILTDDQPTGRPRRYCSTRCRVRRHRTGGKTEQARSALRAVTLAAGIVPELAAGLDDAATILRDGLRRASGARSNNRRLNVFG